MNKSTNRLVPLLAALVLTTLSTRAAVPPPEQLLPSDTLGVFTVPDWSKAWSAYQASAGGQLYQDPSVKPFKDKLLAKFTAEVITPLERELGIKFADYTSLAGGQVTFAVTQGSWQGTSENLPGFLLLLDVKDKQEQLGTRLAELRKKWIDNNKQLRTEKVRDIEFAGFILKASDIKTVLEKAFPGKKDKDGDATEKKDEAKSDEPKKDDKVELWVGRSESLLIVTTRIKDAEKVLIRQSGGQSPALLEQAEFAPNAKMFRDAHAFGWVNVKPFYDIGVREAQKAHEKSPAAASSPSPEKIFKALGLSGLKTLAFRISNGSDGTIGELFAGVPESSREGLFKILSPDAKEGAPPAFVPADAVQFNRFRVDIKKAFATLESILNNVSPGIFGMIESGINMAGKQQNPDFDLRKDLIDNLGDDFVTYAKAARSASLEDVASPPSLFLIGSGNPEKLLQGIRAAMALTPMANMGETVKEREFLGRKIYFINLGDESHALSFTAANGYVALTADKAVLEEFLRSGESGAKSLRENTQLPEAAQKIGGTGMGLFAYENQVETMRATFQMLKNEKFFENLGEGTPFGGALQSDDTVKEIKEWVDFSLLPDFDRIAKYFSIMVVSGGATSDGLSLKFFAPTPAGLKK